VRTIRSPPSRRCERLSEYRYELRRGEEVIATGHLSQERSLEVGDELTIGSERGVVRTIDPVLGERELRLVVQLHRDTAAPS
jgi:hypothetical protein